MMERIVEFIAVIVLPLLIQLVVIAIVLFVLAILLRALRRFTIDRLRYERRFSEECVFEGDSVELYETIRNPTPFPVPFADVESYFYSGLVIGDTAIAKGEMRQFVSRYHLLPFEKVTRCITVRCEKRGFYHLRSVSIFRCGTERFIDSEAQICVYPKIEHMGDAMPAAYSLGDALSRRRLIKNPFAVSGIREYQRGDTFSSVNFKASARLSVGGMPRLVVNHYDDCSNSKYYVYQNFHVPQNKGICFDEYEELMEIGLRISASLVVKALDMGGVCAFSANCGTADGRKKVGYPMRGGERHKREILKEMAMTRAMDGVSFASILAADVQKGVYHSEVFIITTFMDESIAEQISNLEKLGNQVKIITLGEDRG